MNQKPRCLLGNDNCCLCDGVCHYRERRWPIAFVMVALIVVVWVCLLGRGFVHGQEYGPCELNARQTAMHVAASPTPFFALQPGDGRTISEAHLRLPGVTGLTIRVRAQWLSVNGKWDFSFIDQSVARCRNTGDNYSILLMGGDANPLAESSLRFYEAAAKVLGARYASDPLCKAAHITGASPQGHSEELFWGRPMPAAAKAANKRMIDAWSAAFPAQLLPMAGSANDIAAVRELVTYGVAKAPGRFLLKSNALSAKSSLTWEGNQVLVWAAQHGALFGWEMLDDSHRSRYGGTLQQAINNARAIERQAGKPASYIAVYQGDLQGLSKLK